MKVRIPGSHVITVNEVSIILDTGHMLRIQPSGGGILIMSGNAHLTYDEELSNSQQLRVVVTSPDKAEVEEPPALPINEVVANRKL